MTSERTTTDWRAGPASFYDLSPHHPNDLPFYLEHVGQGCSVLELGCGTGRVTLPLAAAGASVYGLDNSAAMLDRLAEKLAGKSELMSRVITKHADITAFDLGRQFDLVIAPFRVMQNLAPEAEVDGLMRAIARHLDPGGLAILNVFNPNQEPADMVATWEAGGEAPGWETTDGPDRIVATARRVRVQAAPLVLFPQLVYRRLRDDRLISEATLDIAMRCYYPSEFVDLIESSGFTPVKKWGGYSGESYGDGPELVVAFTH